MRFADLLDKRIVDAARQRLGVNAPNALQAAALPRLLAGDDAVVSAQTGAGKSLLFLMPMLQRLTQRHEAMPRPRRAATRRSFPEALVLAPSRELSCQLADVATALAKSVHGVRVAAVTGGVAYTPQKRLLRSGAVNLVVATPERLLYHLQERSLSLSELRCLAIDEADALLCGGGTITDEVESLLELIGSRSREAPATPPQHIFTAATLDAAQEAALSKRFPRATRVTHSGVLVPTLQQRWFHTRGDKEAHLVRLLEEAQSNRFLREGATLVFCRNPRRVSHVHAQLAATLPALRPVALHGEQPSAERDSALRALADSEAHVLVCTDVAARGLDLPGVRHVIMYDLPADLRTFIHRAGRTARAGRRGVSSAFIASTADANLASKVRSGEADPDTSLQLESGRRGHRASSHA